MRHRPDPLAHRRAHVEAVAHPPDAHHVAALLVVGVGVEDIVGHVLQDQPERLAGHRGAVGRRVGHRGRVVQVLDRHVRPRRDAGAPAEAGRKRDLGVALRQERVADHVVPRAVHVAAPVERRVGSPDHAGQLVQIRRALRLDQRRHRRVGGDHVGEDGNEAVAEILHAAPVHVQIEAGDELAVRAAGDQHGAVHHQRLGKGVVGVGRQDHVDPVDPRRQLAVHVEAVMREQHDDRGALLLPRLRHQLGKAALADAEAEIREHPAGIRDGHVGKRLPDHGDPRPAALEIGHALVGRLVPFRVEDVRAQQREGQRLAHLAHVVAAVGEFPVGGHGVGAQRVHHRHHVAPLGGVRGIAPLPSIAPVEQQRIGPLGADGVQHGRHAVEATHAPVLPRQRGEVDRGQRVGMGRAGGDAVMVEERLTRDVRRLALRDPDAEIDGRLAEVHGRHLRVDVGDVHKGDGADGRHVEQRGLRHRLARRRPLPPAAPARERGGRDAGLQEFASGNHARLSHRAGEARTASKAAQGRLTYQENAAPRGCGAAKRVRRS